MSDFYVEVYQGEPFGSPLTDEQAMEGALEKAGLSLVVADGHVCLVTGPDAFEAATIRIAQGMTLNPVDIVRVPPPLATLIL